MRYAVVIALLVACIGCANNNEIRIDNISSSALRINFRAVSHDILPGELYTISDIPNGSYDYATTYSIPAWPGITTSRADEGAAGELSFEGKDTKVNFVFSSTREDSTYVLGCTISSTRNLNATSPTSN